MRVETGDDGAFTASGLAGKSFRIRVEAQGYAPLTQPGIPAGANVHLRVQRGATLKGVVRDRLSGNPLAGATVLAWEKDAEPFGEGSYRRATAGKDGRFVVEDLPAGRLTVEARHAGHAPSRTGWIELPEDRARADARPRGRLSGLVSDRLGEPVAGADVRASWREPTGAKSRSAKTGADGRYRIRDAGVVPIDRMTVRAAKFLAGQREGPAPADGVVNFTLERGGIIAAWCAGTTERPPRRFA